jgi:hypothetical protein
VLDEIVREAARQMLAVALQAVVSAYIDAHAEEAAEKVSGGRQRTPPRRADPCRRGIKNGKLIERPDESEGGDQQWRVPCPGFVFPQPVTRVTIVI